MTYQEIKAQLKLLKSQGAIVPPLNSSKEVLEAALNQILASIASPEPEPAIAPSEVLHPVENLDPTPVRIPPENAIVSELKEIAKIAELTLIWSIALVRSLLRFTLPYLIRAGDIALKIAVWTAVLMELWIYPKLQLVGYTVAIWAVLVAIKIRSYRKIAIA